MPFSCFLFRPRKSRERRRKCSHTNVSDASVIRTSRRSQTLLQTPLPCFHASINEYYTAKNGLGTIAPRLLSCAKAGTHSAFGEESHTAAHTAKHGPSLPRPQHGLVLPAKSPPKEQPEEADARLWRVSASSGVAAPLGCVIFSVSVEIAACMPCAQGLSVCARRGVVSLPSARFTCC